MPTSRITDSVGRTPQRNWILVLLLATVALIALSYAPGMQAAAVYLRAATLVATLGALVLAVIGLPWAEVSTGRRRAGRGVALVAMFVAAALVTAGTVVATEDPIPDAFGIDTTPDEQ